MRFRHYRITELQNLELEEIGISGDRIPNFRAPFLRGAWLDQSVECATLNLQVVSSGPHAGCRVNSKIIKKKKSLKPKFTVFYCQASQPWEDISSLTTHSHTHCYFIINKLEIKKSCPVCLSQQLWESRQLKWTYKFANVWVGKGLYNLLFVLLREVLVRNYLGI